MNYQYKSVPIEIKELDDEGYFEGYASVFDTKDEYNDVVVKGAFKKTLEDRGDSIKMLWQHDSKEVIGSYTSMYEDDYGLKVYGQINMEVQRGHEAYSLMKMGAIDAMSIGYTTIQEEYKDMEYEDEYGKNMHERVRVLKELKLYEISLVTFPANEEAMIEQVKELNVEQQKAVSDYINSLQSNEESNITPGNDDKSGGAEESHSELNEADEALDRLIQIQNEEKEEEEALSDTLDALSQKLRI